MLVDGSGWTVCLGGPVGRITRWCESRGNGKSAAGRACEWAGGGEFGGSGSVVGMLARDAWSCRGGDDARQRWARQPPTSPAVCLRIIEACNPGIMNQPPTPPDRRKADGRKSGKQDELEIIEMGGTVGIIMVGRTRTIRTARDAGGCHLIPVARCNPGGCSCRI